MRKIVKYIGLDVHKNSIAIAIAEDGQKKDVDFYGVIKNDMDQLFTNFHENRFHME
jgi:transposase